MKNNLLRFYRIGLVVVLTFFMVSYTGAISEIAKVDNVQSTSLLGSYLAGRFANSQRDTKNAIQYYNIALERDPKSLVLIQQSLLLEITEGRWKQASQHAHELLKLEPYHYIARLYLGSMAYKNKKYAKSREHFSKIGKSPIASLTGELSRAWTYVGENKMSAALKMLKAKNGAEGARFYRRYHRALIADLAGKHKTAESEYRKLSAGANQDLRVSLAYAHHLVNRKKFKQAGKLIEKHIKKADPHPLHKRLYENIKAKREMDLLIKSPDAGLAEVLTVFGEAWRREAPYNALIYFKIALHLNPDLELTHASMASIYESTKKYEEAIRAYDSIKKTSPLWSRAQIRKAVNYDLLKRVDDAKKLLEDLIAQAPNDIRPLNALGDILRRHKRYEEAIKAYDKAILLIKNPEQRHWAQFYFRGVSYERLNKWDEAEKDLKKALSLDPKQPLVLNYLGYSWVDQNRNLKKAMDYIRTAVKLKPNDGYIVDSLGWAHYRLGEYKKAVEILERAVSLEADDPVINDHLGDAYWRVGRRLEARFQWSQVLTLKPEEKVKKEVKRKLKEGLVPGEAQNEAKLEKIKANVIKK